MPHVSFRSTLSDKLTHFFPPPHFLSMPAVGLDVSDSSIKVVELRKGLRGIHLGKWGSHPLPRGTIVGGKIQDLKTLTDELAKVRTRFNFIFAHASLPEQQAYFFTTDIPVGIKQSRIRQIVEFKLESNVPIPVQDAVFDYDVLESPQKSEQLEAGVTVYPKEAVEKFTTALMHAGIVPLSLEIEAQAIERAVVPSFDDGTHLIIDFGETRTGIAISRRSMLVFTSTLEVRGRELTRAIMDHLKLDSAAAERFKNENGLVHSNNDPELSTLIMGTVSALKEEISRHYAYWESRHKNEDGKRESIESILLCGGNANLAGLPEYLSESLQIPVERANVWKNVFSFEEMVPEIDFAHSLSYATAIGLALRELI